VTALILVAAALLAAAITLACNWIGLIPWRRAKDQHWTERARVYHPVRVAAASNLWVLPAVLTLSVYLLWPDKSPHWGFVLLAAAIGAVAGTIPMDREVFARISKTVMRRELLVGWIMRFLTWSVFLWAIALMPEEFNAKAFMIAAVVVTLCIVWNHGGMMRVGRALGFFAPAPERLQNIVRDAAGGMAVSVKEVWLLRSGLAQALAVPATRTLLFTERLLELCPDEELKAICAHELGHLTEARADYLKRYVLWLMFLPWIFFKPMLHKFGLLGFLMLLGITILGPVLFRKVSRKLEVRADQIAHASAPDGTTYARALLRLHEDNLLPAVHAKEQSTHPHLYDRLIAAGMTPDFPRPAAARSMAWHGTLFSALLGILATVLIMRLGHFL
jgi:Zn-dependent protease with chaperone function